MDTPALPVGYMVGGARYLEAVERLGLRPTALFWAYDKIVGHFVLVLVADEYDQAGPLELSKVLFKAYNANATPSVIDPFIVRLHSPLQPVIEEIGKFMPFKIEFQPTPAGDGELLRGSPTAATRAINNAGGLDVEGDWVYRFDKGGKSSSAMEVSRRWRRFAENVDRAAA